MRNFMRAGLLGGLLFVASAGQAQAATTIGSDLTATPAAGVNCAPSLCTYAQRTLPGRQVTAPNDGVIVRWRIKVGTSTGAHPFALRVIRGTGASSTGVSTSEPGIVNGEGTYTFDTRLGIQSGDFIGFDCCNGAGAPAFSTGTLPGVTADYWLDPSLADAETRAPYGTDAAELLFNADIEPDADGDGYGDETQDACPTDASTQGACPDTDGDGVFDAQDNCPTVAGPASNNGCPLPDADGDGTPDAQDNCPAVPGPASNAGCPPPDTSPPESTIDSGPIKTDSRKVTFGFSSSEAGSTFQCKLGGKKVEKDSLKQYRPCTSKKKYKGLEPGKYKFFVYAIDVAGNADPTPAKQKFKIVD